MKIVFEPAALNELDQCLPVDRERQPARCVLYSTFDFHGRRNREHEND